MTSTTLREIAWLGLKLLVPEDWEIVRHSVCVTRGSLIFIDRRRQRLELGWLAVKREPDLDRWAQDLEREERRIDKSSRLHELRLAGGWRALKRTTGEGDVTTRAVRYDSDTAQLIELAIETRSALAEDEGLVESLLAGVCVETSPESARSVSAFDVALEAPEPLRLSAAEVKPADVRLDFAAPDLERDRRFGASASVRRLGMADSWFNGNAEALIRSRDASSTFTSFASVRYAHHEATLAQGLERGPLLKRAFGLIRERRVLLWRCPPKNALFQVSTSSSRREPLWPESFVVRCCGGPS